MKIIGRHASVARAAVREAVKITARRNKGLSERMLGAMHTSGGACLTFFAGGTTTRTKWVAGAPLKDFPYVGASALER